MIRQGIIRLGYVARPYALCGIMDTMVGSLRGLGYSIGPMIVSLIGACGLRVVWIFTISRCTARRRTCTSLIPSPGS